jgi:hypothetical protein
MRYVLFAVGFPQQDCFLVKPIVYSSLVLLGELVIYKLFKDAVCDLECLLFGLNVMYGCFLYV